MWPRMQRPIKILVLRRHLSDGENIDFALNKCADTALGVAHDLDILYFYMFREMFREQSSELWLVNGGRKAVGVGSAGVG